MWGNEEEDLLYELTAFSSPHDQKDPGDIRWERPYRRERMGDTHWALGVWGPPVKASVWPRVWTVSLEPGIQAAVTVAPSSPCAEHSPAFDISPLSLAGIFFPDSFWGCGDSWLKKHSSSHCIYKAIIFFYKIYVWGQPECEARVSDPQIWPLILW